MAKTGTPESEIASIVNSIDGYIVGKISIVDDYQIRFPSKKAKAELENLINYLESFPQIDSARLHTISPMEFEN